MRSFGKSALTWLIRVVHPVMPLEAVWHRIATVARRASVVRLGETRAAALEVAVAAALVAALVGDAARRREAGIARASTGRMKEF